MRRGLKLIPGPQQPFVAAAAARAAPYEKGTETEHRPPGVGQPYLPRARPPMRRGLKQGLGGVRGAPGLLAARAAPYEKGTETVNRIGAESNTTPSRARGPL